jgi:preprotein translocase subunit SecD
MKLHSLSVFALSAAFLVGCGGPATVDYRLTFDTQEPDMVKEFSDATIRVMQRRMERLGVDMTEQSIAKDSDGVTVTIGVSDGGAIQALTDELTAPFDLSIMTTAESETGADLVVEGLGGFNATDVTEDDIKIVASGTNKTTNAGYVLLHFTDAGVAKMRAVFAANVGKDIGLFVRGRLVSSLHVNTAELPSPLVIDGVPNPELAAIFVDDVNVGTHVTVSPL